MKVLVKVSGDPAAWFLVDLGGRGTAGEVRRHIGRKRYAEAIVSALSAGAPAREVADPVMDPCDADLMLTDSSAHWDLVHVKIGTVPA